MLEKKFPYMISSEYCKDWTTVMGIREVIANAFDTDKPIKVLWRVGPIPHRGEGIVYDSGEGLLARHLLLGQSDRTNDDIGQFGEGLKIAALVFARQKRKFEVESNGSKYRFWTEPSQEFNCEMLTVGVSTNEMPRKGTRVSFDATEAEVSEAKQLFLKLQSNVPSLGDGILDLPGEIYVKGVFVGKEPALFGYNLMDKSLMNRDRTVLKSDELHMLIGMELAKTSCDLVIRKYFHEMETPVSSNCVEYKVAFSPHHRTVWKKVLTSIFGRKLCISTFATNADANAEYLGYRVFRVPYNIERTLRSLGVPYSTSVAAKSKVKRVNKKDLTEPEKDMFNKINKLAKKLSPGCWRLQVMESDEFDGRRVRDVLEIERKRLASVDKAASTIIHELAHWSSHATDCSADFERKLTEYLGTLAGLYYEGGEKK